MRASRYRWEKNGHPFDWQVYDDRISQQPGRGTLVITEPRDEDIGEYSAGFSESRVDLKCMTAIWGNGSWDEVGSSFAVGIWRLR